MNITKRAGQGHVPSGQHARPGRSIRIGPHWETAKNRAYKEGVSLAYAIAQLMEAYALRIAGYDLPAGERSTGPSRSIRVDTQIWKATQKRALSEGATTTDAIDRLITGYAQHTLDLPLTRLVAPHERR